MAERVGGRDYPSAEYFRYKVQDYATHLQELKSLGVNPRKIFVGGCGFGADVLACHQVWPDALITAVSVLDHPLPEVREALGQKLIFRDQTILSYLNEANNNFALRGFDLVVFFNVLTDTFREMEIYLFLPKILSPYGYVFEDPWGSIDLNRFYMDNMFSLIALPQPSSSRGCHLWRADY